MPSLSAHVGAREARASGVRFAADAAAAARGGGDATNNATSAAPARLPEADRAVVARRASARRRASAGASTLTAIRETSPRAHPASHPTPARVYRQPDGTLAPRRPPREQHVVAARKEWADLVHHARTHGGDENATAGRCFRHGVGVLYAEHRCARTRTRREDLSTTTARRDASRALPVRSSQGVSAKHRLGTRDASGRIVDRGRSERDRSDGRPRAPFQRPRSSTRRRVRENISYTSEGGFSRRRLSVRVSRSRRDTI